MPWGALTGVASPFPTPYNSEPDQTGPMPAAEAAAKFKVPEGFNVKLAAAEPDVQNPIAMTWDSRGRLWVAENYTYAEASIKFDLGLRDRILIFEDKDGSGKLAERKVFTDELQMLTSLEVGQGGVWAMCPPQLLFIPEGKQADVPSGPPQVVLDGFTIPEQSYHNFANGLRWGPDGWLYGRCGGTAPGDIGAPGTAPGDRVPLRGGMWRYHPTTKVFEALNSGTTNPWGHDWDKYGELFFVNTVNGHLWHSITGAHFVRSSTIEGGRRTYELIDQHADHFHFDNTQHWTKSRNGAADAFGGGHAHIGALIYQGDNWPQKFRDNLFTFNMHGLRANQEILARAGSGYVGHHGDDVFFPSDKWFRGLDLSCGPDGAVFAIDWSDTGECHERNGVHRTSGRVFKIQYGDPKPVAGLDLAKLSASELVQLHSHANAWYERQARRVLLDRMSAGVSVDDAKQPLRALFEKQSDVVIKLRALWSLYAIGGADAQFLESLLQHQDEHIRVWAIRLLTDRWSLDNVTSTRPSSMGQAPASELVAKLTALARTEPSGLVRLALASVLQRLPLVDRPALATELVAHKEDAADHNLPLLVWYGLIPVADANLDAVVKVAAQSQWPQITELIARRLTEDIEQQPAAINRLLEAASVSETFQVDVMRGIARALIGWRKAPKPAAWDGFVQKITSTTDAGLLERVRDLSVVFGDGRALDALKKVALDKNADMAGRKAALQLLIDSRTPDLRSLCESLLPVQLINAVAANGLALFDEPEIGAKLVAAYPAFHSTEKSKIIATLVSRASFVRPLLAAVESGKIPRTSISTYAVRQIRSFKDPELDKKLTAVWGELHESGDDKKALIAKFKTELTPEVLAKADKSQGRVVFNNVCSTCHALYGAGGKIGPDLTGAGRDNLDYLLENIADPSAVVSADFRMTIVNLKDGRVLNGMVRDKTEKTFSLQTMTDKVTLERSDVSGLQELPVSMMPEGLLDALSPNQRRDLIGYLMQRSQVALPAQ